jgi:hypothetical protein
VRLRCVPHPARLTFPTLATQHGALTHLLDLTEFELSGWVAILLVLAPAQLCALAAL